jgi:hypothetical protein
MKTGFIVGGFIVIALIFIGCSLFPVLWGSGNVIVQDYEFGSFTTIDAYDAFNVTIKQGSEYSITVRTDDNLMSHVMVNKVGNNLTVAMESGYNYQPTVLQVIIELPDLYQVHFFDAVKAKIESITCDHSLGIAAEDASSISIPFFSVNGDISITLQDASTLELNGSGDDLMLNVSGAGNAFLGNFQINNADVELSDASRAYINMNGTLNCRLYDASHLHWTGNMIAGEIIIRDASSLSEF